MAEGDSETLDLTLVSTYYEEATGAHMACFVDKDGQAYAVFAGTGANKWRNDCVAGAMADSPQQVKALQWFESLPYDDIIVSGHSKGGNKAMYVTVLSDKADECYVFDGEGFSGVYAYAGYSFFSASGEAGVENGTAFAKGKAWVLAANG